jgi:hypothetical protein
MANYSDLKAPKEEMNEDFEKALMEMDEENDNYMPSSTDIAEAMEPFSKDEIQKYLDSLDVDDEDKLDEESDEEVTEPTMITGGQ